MKIANSVLDGESWTPDVPNGPGQQSIGNTTAISLNTLFS